MRQNKTDAAMAMYQQCITLLAKNEPLSARVWFNFGIAYHKIYNLEKSVACFETACMLDPSFIDAAHNYHVVCKQLARQGRGPTANAKVKQTIRAGETLIDADFYDDGGSPVSKKI